MLTGTFNNKTNGISHRRWLIVSNPELSALIDEAIGTEWRLHPDKLIELEKFADDKAFKNKLWNVKQKRKAILAAYIKKTWQSICIRMPCWTFMSKGSICINGSF
jgi:starch phosphorylase